jgi:SAM-dependent methyltransferase
MSRDLFLSGAHDYFQRKFDTFGATPRGVDWNSAEPQELRFAQLVKIVDPGQEFSIIDYGCGYGALADYLRRLEYRFLYLGYDMVEALVDSAREKHADFQNCQFFSSPEDLLESDYVVESGIFNQRLDVSDAEWTEYVLDVLFRMDLLSSKGFAFNMLTKYSDPEYKRPDLYYADPCFFFDHCKRKFSNNVALLHDYGAYDFTILVRKLI